MLQAIFYLNWRIYNEKFKAYGLKHAKNNDCSNSFANTPL